MSSRTLRRAHACTALVIVPALVLGACSSSLPPAPAHSTGQAATPVAVAAPTETATRLAPTPVPIPSSSSGVIVTPDFEPPAALCPGPGGQVDPPNVRVRVGDGRSMPATMGASGVMTCSTTGSSDVGELEYPAPLVALADDELTFAVDRGWHILWFEEFDHPKRGEGGSMTPGVRVAGGPAEVTIPVPTRTGNMIVGAHLWVVRDDGRVVASVEPMVWVRVEPGG